MVHISNHDPLSFPTFEFRNRINSLDVFTSLTYAMAAPFEPIHLLDAMLSQPSSSIPVTSAAGRSERTSLPATALETAHAAIKNHAHTIPAQKATSSGSRAATVTIEGHDAPGTKGRTTAYRLRSSTTRISVQTPALRIVGGTKGNIRGPQCTVM